MKIGIICAFYDEIIYFVDTYKLDTTKEIQSIKIGDKEVLLGLTGVGKVNAAMMTQKLIDSGVEVILNCGCSGALKEDLPLYSIVLSKYVMYHDFAPLTIMEKYVPSKGKMEADPTFLKQALDLCKGKAIVGGLVSGDCYVETEEKKRELMEKGAICVDMESAAIGHVCTKNKIPFLCIRSISDFANGSEVDEIESSKRAAMITEALIKKL